MNIPRLVIIKTDGSDGGSFGLKDSLVGFGRDDGCFIRLRVPQVSRLHCTLDFSSGVGILTDKSSNGTLLNGIPISGQVVINHGDVICIEDRQFRLELPAGPMVLANNSLSSLLNLKETPRKSRRLLTEPTSNRGTGLFPPSTASLSDALEESEFGSFKGAAPAAELIEPMVVCSPMKTLAFEMEPSLDSDVVEEPVEHVAVEEQILENVKEAPVSLRASPARSVKNSPIVKNSPLIKNSPVAKGSPLVKASLIDQVSPLIKNSPVAKSSPMVKNTLLASPMLKNTSIAIGSPIMAKGSPLVKNSPVQNSPLIKEHVNVQNSPLVKATPATPVVQDSPVEMDMTTPVLECPPSPSRRTPRVVNSPKDSPVVNPRVNVQNSPLVKNSPIVKAPLVKNSPIAKAPLVKNSPIVKAPLVKNSPITKAPLVKNSPIAKAPLIKNSPIAPLIKNSPIAKTPLVKNSPIAKVHVNVQNSPTPQSSKAATTPKEKSPLKMAQELYRSISPSTTPLALTEQSDSKMEVEQCLVDASPIKATEVVMDSANSSPIKPQSPKRAITFSPSKVQSPKTSKKETSSLLRNVLEKNATMSLAKADNPFLESPKKSESPKKLESPKKAESPKKMESPVRVVVKRRDSPSPSSVKSSVKKVKTAEKPANFKDEIFWDQLERFVMTAKPESKHEEEEEEQVTDDDEDLELTESQEGKFCRRSSRHLSPIIVRRQDVLEVNLERPESPSEGKKVRFGPPMDPEVFDTTHPPSTPVARGTRTSIVNTISPMKSLLRKSLASSVPPKSQYSKRVAKSYGSSPLGNAVDIEALKQSTFVMPELPSPMYAAMELDTIMTPPEPAPQNLVVGLLNSDSEASYLGLKETFKSPKNTNVSLIGLKEMLKTPLEKSRTEFIGVKETLKTPKLSHEPELVGVKELMHQKAKSSPLLVGMKETFQTPRGASEASFVGLKAGFRSFVGVKETLKTPRVAKNVEGLDGLTDLMMTPSGESASVAPAMTPAVSSVPEETPVVFSVPEETPVVLSEETHAVSFPESNEPEFVAVDAVMELPRVDQDVDMEPARSEPVGPIVETVTESIDAINEPILETLVEEPKTRARRGRKPKAVVETIVEPIVEVISEPIVQVTAGPSVEETIEVPEQSHVEVPKKRGRKKAVDVDEEVQKPVAKRGRKKMEVESVEEVIEEPKQVKPASFYGDLKTTSRRTRKEPVVDVVIEPVVTKTATKSKKMVVNEIIEPIVTKSVTKSKKKTMVQEPEPIVKAPTMTKKKTVEQENVSLVEPIEKKKRGKKEEALLEVAPQENVEPKRRGRKPAAPVAVAKVQELPVEEEPVIRRSHRHHA